MPPLNKVLLESRHPNDNHLQHENNLVLSSSRSNTRSSGNSIQRRRGPSTKKYCCTRGGGDNTTYSKASLSLSSGTISSTSEIPHFHEQRRMDQNAISRPLDIRNDSKEIEDVARRDINNNDDDEAIGSSLGSDNNSNGEPSDRISKVARRPESSNCLNKKEVHGNEEESATTPSSWLRSNRLWTWVSFLWKKDTPHNNECLAPQIMEDQSLATRSSKSKSFRMLCRWNETTSSGWQMTKIWVFGMLTPVGVVTWMCTHQASSVLISILVLPGFAILQGSLAILKYRVQFGDSPLPKAPSHGIVKCVSRSSMSKNVNDDRHNALGGSIPKGYGSTTTEGSATNGAIVGSEFGESTTSFQGFVDPDHRHHPVTVSSPTSATSTSPLRLLVIGDSLAIGVGQSSTATPVMPESIAKTLSKAMDGRPVLWTCHGAPGASAGWIVRELERSIQQGQFLQPNPPYGRAYPGTHVRNDSNTSCVDGDSCSSSDDSSTGVSSLDISSTGIQAQNEDHQEELKVWSDRLKEHKIRFDPDVLGPFDIAVVITGSNDLKSAFFPFLLTGEDAEFRRQAQRRGGGYGNELTRILQVLNTRMRMRLQTLRESVEAATEKMMESVDSIRERLNSQDLNSVPGQLTSQRRAPKPSDMNGSYGMSAVPSGSNDDNNETKNLLDDDRMVLDGTNNTRSLHASPSFPMVVLPGMPSRALPIFQSAPLRWLAVPIIDIMDSHKKKLARHHDGEVLFIDAPSCEALADYSCRNGIYWDDQADDRLLLNLRGIKRKQARITEADMEKYFSKKTPAPNPETLPLRRRHHSMISVDGIHPNDQGYDFWGRYIGNAIVREWEQNQMEQGNSANTV